MGPIQPVSVAGIEFDALIDSDETYNATVPKYPVDTGYSVSDNMALDNLDLKMTLYLSATPVTWAGRHGSGVSRMQAVCDELLALYFNREKFTVVTQDKMFPEMVVESIEIKKAETQGYAREIPVSFRQVTTTSSQTTEIPASNGKSGNTLASTGTATTKQLSGTTQVPTSQSQSSAGSGSGSGGPPVDPNSLHNQKTVDTHYSELTRLCGKFEAEVSDAFQKAGRR